MDSSIGGTPYCPVGEELPKDKDGNEIPLLLQINFEGIDLPGYPDKGIFQLFMKRDNPRSDYHDTLETGNRIRYYENITSNYRKGYFLF